MCPNPSNQGSVADAINGAVRDLQVRFRGTKDGALLFEPVDDVDDDQLDSLLDGIGDELSQLRDERVTTFLAKEKINALGIVRRNEALVTH